MITLLKQIMTTETKYLLPAIISLIVSATVSALISLLVKKFETRDKLSAEYTHEQRKKVRELTGKFHGRILRACVNLNHRMWNLYSNEKNGWLNANGRYRSNSGYYLISFAHRFLQLISLIRQFEKDAVYLDTRYAKKDDFTFMHYLEAIYWAMTDVTLFKGIEYDPMLQTDHFFLDRLRSYADLCWINNEFISQEDFEKVTHEQDRFDQVLKFFDGLNSSEERLRWDRLIVFHLFIISFINNFGYDPQRTTPIQIKSILPKIRNKSIVDNVILWLPRIGIKNDKEIKILIKEMRAMKKMPGQQQPTTAAA